MHLSSICYRIRYNMRILLTIQAYKLKVDYSNTYHVDRDAIFIASADPQLQSSCRDKMPVCEYSRSKNLKQRHQK